jgi:hypothetical protein
MTIYGAMNRTLRYWMPDQVRHDKETIPFAHSAALRAGSSAKRLLPAMNNNTCKCLIFQVDFLCRKALV